jgi:hypothetical protein
MEAQKKAQEVQLGDMMLARGRRVGHDAVDRGKRSKLRSKSKVKEWSQVF